MARRHPGNPKVPRFKRVVFRFHAGFLPCVQLLCLFMFFLRDALVHPTGYHFLSTTRSLFVICWTKGMLIVMFIGFQHVFSCFFENNSYKDAYQKLDIVAGNPQIWPKYVQLGTDCMHLYEFWTGVIPFLFWSCFFWKNPAEIPSILDASNVSLMFTPENKRSSLKSRWIRIKIYRNWPRTEKINLQHLSCNVFSNRKIIGGQRRKEWGPSK